MDDMTWEQREIKLIKSAIYGYEEAIRRGTTIYGIALPAETIGKYEKEIVILKGKAASILGAMEI